MSTMSGTNGDYHPKIELNQFIVDNIGIGLFPSQGE
jgi:hypothetical protein